MSSFYIKISKNITLVIVALIAVLCISKTSDSQDNNQPLIWTATAMEAIELHPQGSVFKNHNSEQMKSIQLMSAKGEYEAFQIVIQAPPGNLSNVNVVISDLKNSDGSVISNNDITLYREHYIKLDRPSPQRWANPTRGKGWYADALIPFVDPETGQDIQGGELDAVPFNLEAGYNQPIWVDIFVPKSTSPGEYKGKYTVTSDLGIDEGEINLTVWNFDLPVQPSMNSAFDIWKNRGIEAQTLLLQHKLMPSQRIKYDNQAEVFEKLGVNSVRLMTFWSGADYHTCKMDSAPSVAELKKAAAQYPSELLRYVYSADEIDECENLEQPLKQWGKNIHQAGLKHLVVMKPKPELYDDIDIWVVNPKMYEEARSEIAEEMQRGDEIWFYTGYSTDYSPLWHLDSAPINFRIPQGWIAHSLDLKGVLVARVDTWTDDPWSEVPIYVQGNKDYPGIEMFFYPGDKVGLNQVVPSIRLKRLREGMEDYEYTEILKKLGHQDWAMKIVRRVGKNWRYWTKNPNDLYAARQKLGEKIHQLNTTPIPI